MADDHLHQTIHLQTWKAWKTWKMPKSNMLTTTSAILPCRLDQVTGFGESSRFQLFEEIQLIIPPQYDWYLVDYIFFATNRHCFHLKLAILDILWDFVTTISSQICVYCESCIHSSTQRMIFESISLTAFLTNFQQRNTP